ncbi:MAG: DUF4885 domain-containing protein [Oxalobacter formigenes]|nr:DUF4885 domain-containing protein [Oxalobacter formigenes]
MPLGLDTAYYNYYNVKGRYSPDTPKTPEWKNLYTPTEDQIRSNNHNPESELCQAFLKLEETYYAASVSNREKYKTEDALKQALAEKYLTGSAYSQYSRTERNAMYQNELNMSLFGCASFNLNDPHLSGPVMGETDEEKAGYNRQRVNIQINAILANAQIDTGSLGKITFSIEPYNHTLSVAGVENPDTAAMMEKLLNEGRNSTELFHHIFKSNYFSIAEDIKTKYRLLQDFKNITGLDLRLFHQTGNGLENKNGQNALDLYREGLKTTGSVPAAYKGVAYDLFAEKITLLGENFANIPEMNLSIDFANGQLQDTAFDAAITKKVDVFA